MSIDQIEFVDLERKMKGGKPAIQFLALNLGKAYVITITRDGCPACERQKPRLAKLAKEMTMKLGDKVVFIRVHVKQPSGDVSESLRAKDTFGHYFYPTNLILIRTRDRGAVELYRNVSPRMSELRSNVETAVKTADMLAREKS